MVYYVGVLDICVILACVYVCMLSDQGPMGILYAFIFIPVFLYVGRGLLFEVGRDPLY